MAREGARPGADRKPGSKNGKPIELGYRIDPTGNVLRALVDVAELLLKR
jgi:hypothetical protein